jgi:hypothetical protein
MRVLGQWASHLLLIRTNLGCGTALTAACARQGSSATDYYLLLLFYIVHRITLCKLCILRKYYLTLLNDTVVRSAFVAVISPIHVFVKLILSIIGNEEV